MGRRGKRGNPDQISLTRRKNFEKKMRLQPDFLVFKEGLRIIKPYFFPFRVNAKGRWQKRSLVEVWSTEFRGLSKNYLYTAIRLGRIRVNNKRVEPEYLLNNNDQIEHCYHRHERPIADIKLNIVFEDDNILVVNKPASWPVHPTGCYYHNTLTQILITEYNYPPLRTAHRIDRLTSGLVILSKNAESDREIKKSIREQKVEKVYLAEVEGVFPESTIQCDLPLVALSKATGVQRVCLPREYAELMQIKSQRTQGDIDDTALPKDASTQFKRLKTSGHTSIVICRPKTGRTHQIRVHLQYLGYPIVNDRIYNSTAFGPEKGKNGHYDKDLDELKVAISAEHSAVNWIVEDDGATRQSDIVLPNNQFELEELVEKAQRAWANPYVEEDEFCNDCKTKTRQPTPCELTMNLHCWKYSSDQWEYETPLPKWAQEYTELTSDVK